MSRMCVICKQGFPLTGFSYRNKAKGERHRQCKKCQGVLSKKYYRANKEHLLKRQSELAKETMGFIKEKKNVPCADCGQTYHYCAMDFDHVRGEKLMNVARMARSSKKKIEEEIAKCEVVCSNCHRMRTFARKTANAVD